ARHSQPPRRLEHPDPGLGREQPDQPSIQPIDRPRCRVQRGLLPCVHRAPFPAFTALLSLRLQRLPRVYTAVPRWSPRPCPRVVTAAPFLEFSAAPSPRGHRGSLPCPAEAIHDVQFCGLVPPITRQIA